MNYYRVTMCNAQNEYKHAVITSRNIRLARQFAQDAAKAFGVRYVGAVRLMRVQGEAEYNAARLQVAA